MGAAAGMGGMAAPPAAERLRNSMQSSTASLRYESAYAGDGLAMRTDAVRDGLMRTDAALDGALAACGCCCCGCRRAALQAGDEEDDTADSIASRRSASRTRSITDDDDDDDAVGGAGAGAPPCFRGARRRAPPLPPPPRSLGMHVGMSALRGSAGVGWKNIWASISDNHSCGGGGGAVGSHRQQRVACRQLGEVGRRRQLRAEAAGRDHGGSKAARWGHMPVSGRARAEAALRARAEAAPVRSRGGGGTGPRRRRRAELARRRRDGLTEAAAVAMGSHAGGAGSSRVGGSGPCSHGGGSETTVQARWCVPYPSQASAPCTSSDGTGSDGVGTGSSSRGACWKEARGSSSSEWGRTPAVRGTNFGDSSGQGAGERERGAEREIERVPQELT
ncbi:hypothetical protein BRADI_5g01863v3 [Brachypodium distachyon]|uniref:Uncharacterized protein n=1 Tax=Brachypodium distachyon TaxID=15368 RepID=A0A0Q3GLJ1_BRADI|nr:hypothetical protein BRADI_5g01863v3 [Brachypodium distachyon]